MSDLDAMVAQGYEEARAIKVEQVTRRRAWRIQGREYTDRDLRDLGINPANGVNHSDLQMLQLYESNLIGRQTMMGQLPAFEYPSIERARARGRAAVNIFEDGRMEW